MNGFPAASKFLPFLAWRHRVTRVTMRADLLAGLISALVVEAVRLYESGVASAEDIDTACKLGFGHAMGPLATTDPSIVPIRYFS